MADDNTHLYEVFGGAKFRMRSAGSSNSRSLTQPHSVVVSRGLERSVLVCCVARSASRRSTVGAGTSTACLVGKLQDQQDPTVREQVSGWAVSSLAQSGPRCLEYGPNFSLDRCRFVLEGRGGVGGRCSATFYTRFQNRSPHRDDDIIQSCNTVDYCILRHEKAE